jgi:hypothetical protein
MINKLLGQGIEVHRAAAAFTHEGKMYGAGSFVVPMAQPKMGVIRWLLGRTFYPQNSYTIDGQGRPIRPYDMAADVMAEFMGVRVDAVDTQVEASLTKLSSWIEPVGEVASGGFGYVVDGRQNRAFGALNLLFDKGIEVWRVDAATHGLNPGDFVVPGGSDADIAEIAGQTGVDFKPLDNDVNDMSHELDRLRIGMYQRYYGGNMDEGWTRWLLEDFGFPHTTLMDADITAGDLEDDWDVIILPADRTGTMLGDIEEEEGPYATGPLSYPPQYRSGFGQQGVNALKSFVLNGGTLLTFAEAGDLAIEEFDLPLRNVVADVPSTEFWCPGSTLRMNFDVAHSLAYGMPAQGVGTFLARNQAYQIVPTAHNERIEIVATFPDRDLLQSGWLIGEDLIAEKAAVVSVGYGEGQVVLIGFRAQHRAQTHGTFKLVFNALVQAP